MASWHTENIVDGVGQFNSALARIVAVSVDLKSCILFKSVLLASWSITTCEYQYSPDLGRSD